jgi:glycine cleavage system H protein
MNVPDQLHFADSHEWVDTTDPTSASVGISDHAQEELTDVVYLELPEVGTIVTAGEAVGVIESVKAANDLYTPCSGEIIEVNSALEDAPEAVNTDPYATGWMFKLALSDPSEISKLKDAAAYRSLLGG